MDSEKIWMRTGQGEFPPRTDAYAALRSYSTGSSLLGRLFGQFPHERIPGDKVTLYVHPDNPNRMRDLDAEGQERHWIFEVHFVDRARQIGGFYEELLTVG
jgi:Xaa-Pro dipeptidase